MRVCLVYDCLFPHTVGGAERWYRNLAERLAAEGHMVTYLTLRQWSDDEDAGVPGVAVIPVGPRLDLYVAGRRRITPPLRFGWGVLDHLWRHGSDYDIVHMASFPYFSLLAAWAARRRHRFRLFVDWFEVWTRAYWRDYLGRVAGDLGWLVQRRCARVPHTAFCYSRLHERRLRELGFDGPIHRLGGLYEGSAKPTTTARGEPLVVYAGRHIPEKRVPALVHALPLARERIGGLRAWILGDGPTRTEVLRLIEELGLDGVVEAPGFVAEERVDEALRQALCLVLPSRREGYGLVVIEASARGTPSVVVREPDNAATELVDDGENGVVSPSAEPEDLADAIARVHAAGETLRRSTESWFGRNARRLSLENSLETVLSAYGDDSAPHPGDTGRTLRSAAWPRPQR